MSKTEKPKSWRDVIKVHPAAELFPMASPEEKDVLSKDIKKRGICVPLVLWQSEHGTPYMLLDGRNRLDAAEAAGISVLDRKGERLDCRNYDVACGGDPYKLVLTLNMHRRHLTPDQKRDVIAKLLKTQPSKSNRMIAKQVMVDDKTVGSVRHELEGRAEIPHVSTVEDTKGRKQPTRKKRRTADDVVDEKAIADRAPDPSKFARTTKAQFDRAVRAAVEAKRAEIKASVEGVRRNYDPARLRASRVRRRGPSIASRAHVRRRLQENPDVPASGHGNARMEGSLRGSVRSVQEARRRARVAGTEPHSDVGPSAHRRRIARTSQARSPHRERQRGGIRPEGGASKKIKPPARPTACGPSLERPRNNRRRISCYFPPSGPQPIGFACPSNRSSPPPNGARSPRT